MCELPSLYDFKFTITIFFTLSILKMFFQINFKNYVTGSQIDDWTLCPVIT